jgi:hypothetical protein
MENRIAPLLILLLLLSMGATAQKTGLITFKANTGIVYSLPSKITFKQAGQPDISFRGRYRAESLVLPIYWDYSLEYSKNGKSYGIRTTHHKVILDNPQQNVQAFEMTHGFNMVNLFYAQEWRSFRWLVGAGVTAAHPESTVRNNFYSVPGGEGALNSSYVLVGPNIIGSLNRRFYFGNTFFWRFEGKVSWSYFDVPIYEGRAKGTNLALHFLTGFGLDLGKKSTSQN